MRAHLHLVQSHQQQAQPSKQYTSRCLELADGQQQGSSAELREMAAEGLGEVVEGTSPEALRPFVVQITGPLIRIVGDRFPSPVRGAILGTLGALIARAGPGLKPFVPQLQTTFLKCLQDQSAVVRSRAAANLGRLTAMSLRIDQLALDLLASARSAEPAMQESFLAALHGLLAVSGGRLSAPVLANVGASLQEMLPQAGEEAAVVSEAAACVGAWAAHCALDEAQAMLVSGPLRASAASAGGWGRRLGHILTVAAVAKAAPQRLDDSGLRPAAESVAALFVRDPEVAVKVGAAKAAASLAASQPQGALGDDLAGVAVALLGPDQASETQRAGLAMLRAISRSAPDALRPHLPSLVPPVANLVQETVGPTKLAVERTLALVLQLTAGSHDVATAYLTGPPAPGGLVRSLLSEAYLRRLSKLPQDDADADEL